MFVTIDWAFLGHVDASDMRLKAGEWPETLTVTLPGGHERVLKIQEAFMNPQGRWEGYIYRHYVGDSETAEVTLAVHDD